MILKHLRSWLGFGEVRCAHCLAPYFKEDLRNPDLSASLRLCPDCQESFYAYLGPTCRRCGLPTEKSYCKACKTDPPPWDHLAYYGLYQGPLRDIILRLKFDAEIHLARLLAEFLLEAIKCLPEPDLILAIPQFPKRLRKRGFNQAHEIGRYLAALTGFPLTSTALLRVRSGPAQENLSAQQRRVNMAGAFKAGPEIKGKSIWLLDDVLTTGSTCRAATEALFEAGARKVSLVFAARTPLG